LENDSITLVKSQKIKNTNFENFINDYPFISDVKWRAEKGENNSEIVVVSAQIDVKKIVHEYGDRLFVRHGAEWIVENNFDTSIFFKSDIIKENLYKNSNIEIYYNVSKIDEKGAFVDQGVVLTDLKKMNSININGKKYNNYLPLIDDISNHLPFNPVTLEIALLGSDFMSKIEINKVANIYKDKEYKTIETIDSQFCSPDIKLSYPPFNSLKIKSIDSENIEIEVESFEVSQEDDNGRVVDMVVNTKSYQLPFKSGQIINGLIHADYSDENFFLRMLRDEVFFGKTPVMSAVYYAVDERYDDKISGKISQWNTMLKNFEEQKRNQELKRLDDIERKKKQDQRVREEAALKEENELSLYQAQSKIEKIAKKAPFIVVGVHEPTMDSNSAHMFYIMRVVEINKDFVSYELGEHTFYPNQKYKISSASFKNKFYNSNFLKFIYDKDIDFVEMITNNGAFNFDRSEKPYIFKFNNIEMYDAFNLESMPEIVKNVIELNKSKIGSIEDKAMCGDSITNYKEVAQYQGTKCDGSCYAYFMWPNGKVFRLPDEGRTIDPSFIGKNVQVTFQSTNTVNVETKKCIKKIKINSVIRYN
jgi:hypothetical protein